MSESRSSDHPELATPPRSDGSPPSDGAAAGVDHLVVTVHGIRTFGPWQTNLAKLVQGPEPTGRTKVIAYRYGYFPSIFLIMPVLRWIAARHFYRELRMYRKEHPLARIDLVAHSFGTYTPRG
jgi:hypothetical protein